jgi:hypothetical protein
MPNNKAQTQIQTHERGTELAPTSRLALRATLSKPSGAIPKTRKPSSALRNGSGRHISPAMTAAAAAAA